MKVVYVHMGDKYIFYVIIKGVKYINLDYEVT